MQSKITVLALAISTTLVIACNHNDDEKSTPKPAPAPTPIVKTGVLIDSAVVGVSDDSAAKKAQRTQTVNSNTSPTKPLVLS